jgi:hypothetical protein
LLRDFKRIVDRRIVQENQIFGERFDAIADASYILTLGQANRLEQKIEEFNYQISKLK